MTSLVELRRRGGKVVVVNPLREPGLVEFRVPSRLGSLLFGSQIASEYVQPKIGGDIALLAGVAKATVPDRDFGVAHTEGLDALQAFVAALTWEEIEDSSGVSREQIEEVARLYAASERTIFAWTMGITHHEHGVENVQWIVNLALLRGMVGKPGSGLMPIRGHSNVQGLGSMGVYPGVRAAALKKLTELGVCVPEWKGHDTMAAMEAAARGEMDFALCLGGNLFGANPDANFASDALASVNSVVYLSTTLNTGHVRGRGQNTLILPVCARDEESQKTTQESMFSYVRVSDGGPKRHAGARTEVEILAGVGRLLFPHSRVDAIDWSRMESHDAIRELIATLVPEYEQIVKATEFQIPGRALHGKVFPTASGKATFRPHPIPAALALGPNQLRLMTIRSEGQFNTVVYEEEDIYRGQDRRDVILLLPKDMERLGVVADQPVRVSSESGAMIVIARPFDIAQGCAAMYYPEANDLVGKNVDPRSKTPSFKSVVVDVIPWEGNLISRETIATSTRGDLKAC
jgi:molybdopterin-dependent oxidoreductase alpha subunit